MDQDRKEFTKKQVDESWKDRMWTEKDSLSDAAPGHSSEKQSYERLTFSSFISSLALQALIYLGVSEDPTHQANKDLAQAQQMIDLLMLIKEKTKNNLTPAEKTLLDSILTDVQLRYVQSAESK